MQGFEYFMAIDEQYHDEVYKLLQVLEISMVDEETAELQKKAEARLEELKKLSA